jgi:hypothetical protein
LAWRIKSGILAFVICLIAGMYILINVGFDDSDGALYTGIGLYFIGKAVFVGPMLIITTLHMTTPKENI